MSDTADSMGVGAMSALERARMKALNERRWRGVEKLRARTIPGLPVDADAMELRHPIPRLDSVLDGLLNKVECERDAFYDTVCEQWSTLFPELPARPGRYQEHCLYLYVRSAAVNFAVRPKLADVKRRLVSLEGAPKRFDVRLEIHA